MKIQKGYTLSQFVDLILNEEITAELKIEYLHEINAVIDYNEFLKQKPTKGMFIPCEEDGNELHEPKAMIIYKMQRFECTADEMRLCREYLEAESKVIFKDDKFTYSKDKDGNLIINIEQKYELLIRQYGVYISEGNDCFKCLESLAEIFRLTNGEIELKNIEI